MKMGDSLKIGSKGNDVKKVQSALNSLGFICGKADGIFGKKTEQAIFRYKEKFYKFKGIINYSEFQALEDIIQEKSFIDEIPFKSSPHYSERPAKTPIDMIVIHYTASGTLSGVIKWFKDKKSKVSAHYVIGKDGKIVQMVHDKDKAWHCGKSEWEGIKNCNDFSLGIEIVNFGQLKKKGDGFVNYLGKKYKDKPYQSGKTYWDAYTHIQHLHTVYLLRVLMKKYDIPLERIVGHSDVSPKRKIDPGPGLNWPYIRHCLEIKT